MSNYDRSFTPLPSAKRHSAEASAEIVTRLGLPGSLIVITGVASDGVDEEQVVTIDADGGTFTLTYDGQETAALDFDATAAEVQTALRALSNISDTDVTVAGDAGGPWTVSFADALAAQDVELLEIDTTSLTKAGSVAIATVTAGAHTAAEADTQSLIVAASSGTFKLTYEGQQTAALDFDATAAEVQTALEALSNIAPGDIEVTGGPGDQFGSQPYLITFVAGGALAGADLGVTAQDVDLANSGEVRVDRTQEGSVNVNEIQVITKRSGTGGSFKLTFGDQETAAIAHNASAATVQTRLRDLSNIGASDVDVTGDNGGPWTAEFKTDLGLAPQDLLEVTDNSLTLAPTLTAGQVLVGIAASTASNEVQTVTPTGTGGTFTLTWDGQTTGAIAFDASAADVQTALEALSNVAVGDVRVTGDDGGPWTVEFMGTQRYTDVAEMTATSSLTQEASGEVEESVKGEVAGTALGWKMQVPDGNGGWTDYVDSSAVLADDGSYPVLIHPTAAAAPAGGAKVNVSSPIAFRILAVQVGVWTYTITGQYVA